MCPIISTITLIISIHALRKESDHGIFTAFYADCLFLSTLSARRATSISYCKERTLSIFLSTLSARRATEKVPADVFYQAFLSTLSARRATRRGLVHVHGEVFLSTLSARRATR